MLISIEKAVFEFRLSVRRTAVDRILVNGMGNCSFDCPEFLCNIETTTALLYVYTLCSIHAVMLLFFFIYFPLVV
jgi:hypothetical protein